MLETVERVKHHGTLYWFDTRGSELWKYYWVALGTNYIIFRNAKIFKKEKKRKEKEKNN